MIKLFPLENFEINGTEVDTFSVILIGEEIEIIIELTLFLVHLSLKHNSKKTVKAYGKDLIKFFRELDTVYNSRGDLKQDFREVTNNQMNAYINFNLRKKYGLKLSTIKRHIVSLNAFYEYAYNYGWISERKGYTFSLRHNEIKTTELEGITKKLSQEYMDEKEFKKLLDIIPSFNHFKNKRDRLALMLGYYVGFRTGELVDPNNLRIDYLDKLITVDEDNVPRIDRPMKIIGKGNKIRNARVCAEIFQPLYDFLKIAKKIGAKNLMCKSNGDPLKDSRFGTDLFHDATNILLSTGKFSKEESEIWINRHYHCCRKCYATNSVTYCYHPNIKLDHRTHVTNWMGHADPKTTEIYIYFEALIYQRHKILKEIDYSRILDSFNDKKSD